MSRIQKMRLHFTDGSHLDVAENDPLQTLTSEPSAKQEPGYHRLNGTATPAEFGKLTNVRAVMLTRGQKVMTFRGLLTVEGVRRG